MNVKEIADQVIGAVRDYVARAVEPIMARLGALEERPVPQDGKSVTLDDIRPMVVELFKTYPAPKDGASVTLDDVRPMIEHVCSSYLQGLPAPQDGKSVTLDDIRPMVQQYLDAIPAPKDGASVTFDDVWPAVHEHLKAIPAPRDGTSVTLDDVRPMVEEFLRALPTPKDGKSVEITEVRELLEGHVAKWALDFERRAQDILQRAIDRMPVPKDGKDGVSFDELEIEQVGDRILRHVYRREGAIVKSFDYKMRCQIYREIYRQGERYERDDTVTFGGSVWSATRDTDSKPGTDDSWRLAVKAGRDGQRPRDER